VREWRRCSTDRNVRRDPNQGLRLRAVSKHQEEKHLAAAVRDLEAIDFRLVEPSRPPTSFRDESCFRDESERRESPNTPVARGDRHTVSARDRLGGEVLLMQCDQDPQGVVVQEGLPVFVVQKEILGHQSRSRGRTSAIGRSDKGHVPDSRSLA